MQPQLYNPGGQSPFDAIKQTRPDGSEFWTGRDLMDAMGYTRWENFKTPLIRAIESSKANGTYSDVLFHQTVKKAGLFTKPAEDYELSRYAAYLVAMNGNPNMPKVAAAQSYFAIQTRVAETAPAKSPAELSRKEILLLALEAEERAEQAEAQVKELTPAATAFEHWKQKDDGMNITDLNKKLVEVYPGMNLNILREHMLKRDELGKREIKDSRTGETKVRYKPKTVMFRNGWAFEYQAPKANGQHTAAWKYTLAYYEVLVKRFSSKLAAAGEQGMLEVA